MSLLRLSCSKLARPSLSGLGQGQPYHILFGFWTMMASTGTLDQIDQGTPKTKAGALR